MNEQKPKRDRGRLWALIALLVCALAIFHPAQIWFGEATALREETLDQNYFYDLLRGTWRPQALIEAAWATGKVPHREAVAYLLKDLGKTNALPPELFSKIIGEAIQDADLSVRELAMASLAARKEVTLDAATRQLRDVDPQTRLMGLEYLRDMSAKGAIPALMQTITDPDVTVSANSVIMLQKMSGQDFAFNARALREDPKSSEGLQGLHDSIAKAQIWWQAQGQNYPTNIALSPITPNTGHEVADFELRDLGGKPVRLSDFHGKAVLLNFWTTWCTACRSEFATLNAWQQRHTNDFVILGISLDGANGELIKSDEKPADSETPATLPEIQKEVQRVAKVAGLKYKILLDPSAAVGARFNGGELPTNILIDSSGRLRRRFVGPRSLEVFEAMLAELKER